MYMITDSTLADHFRPARNRAAWTYDVSLVVFGSALIALSAQVAIHLPPLVSPILITGQTFASLLVAALYGSK